MTVLMYGYLVLFSVISLAVGKDSQCSVPRLLLNHYEEANCKPVMDQKCPIRYECPNFEANDPDKCYVNGKAYERGQRIPNEEYNSPCSRGCYCDDHSPKAHITCAHVDCPSVPILQLIGDKPQVCVKQQSLDECCATEQICDEDEVAKLATCKFEGLTYRGGEKIYPKSHPCYTCICGEGFDGNSIEKSAHCKKINCGVQLEQDKLRDGCIPIYYGTERCCNIGWRCPADEDDVVIKSSKGRSGSVDLENGACSFGALKMNVDDTLSSDDDNVECKCMVPPLPHCIKKPVKFD